MAIPNITEIDIIKALKYIDEKGVPEHNESTKYELVANDGKKYPPKYVIAVADHLANGKAVATDSFNAVEAVNFLKSKGFVIQTKQVKYELTITADSVVSTDERFTMNDLGLGDNYKPLDAYMEKADGEVIRRKYVKGERRISNMTMPRIICQVFERQIAGLSDSDRENFPTCRYSLGGEIYRGIYPSVDEYRLRRKTIEYMIYGCSDGKQFVFYSWNIFSTIIFVQECLRRFGDSGDKVILIYREKNEEEILEEQAEAVVQEESERGKGYVNAFSQTLLDSKNVIFRGAPGTGKSYLAKEIAADIISNGYYDKFESLNDEQKKQVEFVQFHPSYDYTDFVEGLRPKINEDGSMGFELQDGIFKKFVERAKKNYENSLKPLDKIKKELTVQEAITEFFSNFVFGLSKLRTINGNEFTITDVDDNRINISIPGNATVNKLCLNLGEIREMLESGVEFGKIKDVTNFFGKTFATQAYSYDFAIYKAIKERNVELTKEVKREELKKYIFIIDEINRGEISKIFGELFFAIDPGYRGVAGEVSTQYSNMHADPDEKFYIPENVYIIGTMNDIDRSVDSFDFAMRRRFRFIELKADERLEMLDLLEDDALKAEAIKRMTALNREIAAIEELNENYQIGAAYFLKLKELDFDRLWTDYLKPLLQEYVNGMYDEAGIMSRFEKAYGYKQPKESDINEDTQD